MNPLWNTLVVGGFTAEGEGYLGYVDKIGVAYTDSAIATGYGSYIALVSGASVWSQLPKLTPLLWRLCSPLCAKPWIPTQT